MAKLNFKGPFHLKELSKIDEIREGKGVYIWGFMYLRNGESIGENVDFSVNGLPAEFDPGKMQFIPYYVGIGESTPIFKRLLKHSKSKYGDATKYIRLSHDYMKEFFIGFPNKIRFKIFPHFEFPIKIHGPKYKNNEVALNLINSYRTSKITYFNSDACLSAIYSGISPTGITRVLKKTGKVYTNYPITNQRITVSPTNIGGHLPDTLSDLINDNNNFWFCYSLNPDDKHLTQLETYTFWSLKGLTTGETGSFESIGDVSHTITSATGLNIFKKNRSNGFPGYI
jgi:hypothetical protein